jgi:hypothetical protein
MAKVGQLSEDVIVESVLRSVDGAAEHRYRLVGGPDDGREFTTLAEVGGYVQAAADGPHLGQGSKMEPRGG